MFFKMIIKLETWLRENNLSYLNAKIVLRAEGNEIESRFILDTGSPRTIVNFSDAESLEIDFEDLKKAEMISIGGRRYQGYVYSGIAFRFVTEENEIIEERMEVRVIKEDSKEGLEEIHRVPMILGTDFLQKKGYKLFCDFVNERAFLEK